jgi:antitoxin (DNA-binding transcriptional repressor) of toxin-antitoxin stability system
MTTATVHQAKTHLSRLLRLVEAGEEVLILKGTKSIAKLVPLSNHQERKPGVLEGIYHTSDSFFDPLPEEEIKAWE